MIRGNLIYDNADRGVQLYPDAKGSVVTGNMIDGNGEGMIFGGGPSLHDNVVANNVITGSTIRWNIQSHWQGPVGSGNVARDNCVWSGLGGYYGGGDPVEAGSRRSTGSGPSTTSSPIPATPIRPPATSCSIPTAPA